MPSGPPSVASSTSQNEPLFGPDTLRLATALNYSLLGLSGMAVLSLAILSISVLVLRAQVLARWVGYVGLGCGLPMLASVIAQYGAFTTILGVLWAFCLAVAIWRGHDDTAWDVSRTMTGWRTGRGTSGSCRLSPSTAPRTSTTSRSR